MKVKSYKTSYILDNIESSVDEFINYNKKFKKQKINEKITASLNVEE